MEKISGIYKITNTATGDFYIGSSKDVKSRWAHHKWPSTWKQCPNNPMYLDMQKYGTDKFEFQILAEVEVEKLKEMEQQFIEKLQPTYNSNRANGFDVERRKEYHKQYNKSDKFKEYHKQYQKTDKCKEYHKQYHKTDKYKESHKKANKQYNSQLCFYNGETLTLCALRERFKRQGIVHSTIEAKKYLINN